MILKKPQRSRLLPPVQQKTRLRLPTPPQLLPLLPQRLLICRKMKQHCRHKLLFLLRRQTQSRPGLPSLRRHLRDIPIQTPRRRNTHLSLMLPSPRRHPQTRNRLLPPCRRQDLLRAPLHSPLLSMPADTAKSRFPLELNPLPLPGILPLSQQASGSSAESSQTHRPASSLPLPPSRTISASAGPWYRNGRVIWCPLRLPFRPSVPTGAFSSPPPQVNSTPINKNKTRGRRPPESPALSTPSNAISSNRTNT